MSLGRVLKGSTGPAWTVQVLTADNSVLPITGATVTGVMYDRQGPGVAVPLTNSFGIVDGPNGKFGYSPSAADVATYGSYDIYWYVNVSGLVYVVQDDIEIVKVP